MADKEKITWSCAVQVAGGPTLSSSDSMQLAGYEKWRLVIDHNKTGVAKIGDAAGVTLVAIVPSKASDKLTYKHGGNDVKLDRAQVLAGEGAVQYIKDAFPDLTIDNKTGAEVTVDILVGRA
jgi:hypothetical protein